MAAAICSRYCRAACLPDKSLSPPYITLLGGINMDVSVHAHSTLRAGDSNPGQVQCSPGGVARNVAENLSRLGQDVRLLGVLGDDAFGQALRAAGVAVGLDMGACLTLPGQRSATYVCLHRADGDMDVAVNDMDIMDALTPALLQPQMALLRSAAVLVADCNLRPDVWQWLAAEVAHPALFAEAVSVAKCMRLGAVLGACAYAEGQPPRGAGNVWPRHRQRARCVRRRAGLAPPGRGPGADQPGRARRGLVRCRWPLRSPRGARSAGA